MNTLTITPYNNQTAYYPGDEITGEISWELDKRPSAIELRLFWYTSGKGSTDAGIVDTLRLDAPADRDRRVFRLRFPDAPYSYAGNLISILWALELVAEPGNLAQRLDLVMSPTQQPVASWK